MEIDIFWTLLGIVVWPGLTLCIILWKLGHPFLGILALILTPTKSNAKTKIREKITDSATGRTIKQSTYEE
jgi:hypothetical protein